jgi:hypothetical protein
VANVIQNRVPVTGFFPMAANRTKKFAGVLLLIFLAQCVWLIHAELRSEFGCYPAGTMERQSPVAEGLRQWRGQGIAGTPGSLPSRNATPRENSPVESFQGYDPYRSPVWYLVAAAPVALGPSPLHPKREKLWLWLTRVPYLIFGVLLGASLWYVTRRLYGNPGGVIALVLYCFSPGIIQSSSEVCRDSEMGAAWGAFGSVFTAIALAHTLYAPREVVLWNWRRIILLAISLALAIGSQFSLSVLAPVTLGFLLYLAPQRRMAAATVWAAACAGAGVLLAAAYFFHFEILWQGLRAAKLVDFTAPALSMSANYRSAAGHILKGSPLLIVLLPVAGLGYVLWRRARYFSNTAPLLVAAICLALGLAAPTFPGQGFWLVAMPFLFAFVAGVFADLLETRFRSWLRILLTAVLSGYAFWSLVALAQV